MKIKNGFVLEKVGESYLACATGKLATEFSGFVRLNETGALIWGELDKGTDEKALASLLCTEYGIGADVAERDVEAFLSTLRNNGILDE